MKKTILLLCLLFGSLLTYAQKYMNVTHLQPGVYNEYSKTWKWGKTEAIDLQITLSGSDIYVNDKAETHVRTYEDLGSKTSYDEDGDKYTLHTWRAIDEKQRKCLFLMTLFQDLKLEIYTIVYSDYGFRYYINTSKGIDKFVN